ncbi:hypothetical protein DPMN_168284 [Dreissena polymorpha]|uniref:Ig-like domain-containing protein n=2 Tax=Dreissena polymorpha TaxID=45954 RepID=A0A9D4F0C7_DREPO|nr:hypothetical protein DPMN_168284 [Dreissena polymorpha]
MCFSIGIGQINKEPDFPVRLHHLFVTSLKNGSLHINICYSSKFPVQTSWIIDEGFVPTFLSPKALVSETKHSNGSISASMELPPEVPLTLLRFHVACKKQSLLVYTVLYVSHGMADTFEEIKQFSLYMPPANEVGITPGGEARFHAVVDTSGTKYKFGLLQTELSVYSKRLGEVANSFFTNYAAFSFLPTNTSSPIAQRQIVQTSTEYHADIILTSKELYKNGAVVSILAVCANPTALIQRMDVMKLMYLRPMGSREPVAPGTLGFIDEEYNIPVQPSEHALVRCKLVGNPVTNITLHMKPARGGDYVPVDAPVKLTAMEYETTAVFHLLNTSSKDAGGYICKATDGVTEVRTRNHELSILTADKVKTAA